MSTPTKKEKTINLMNEISPSEEQLAIKADKNYFNHLTYVVKELLTPHTLEDDMTTPKLSKYFEDLGATEEVEIEPLDVNRWGRYYTSYIFHDKFNFKNYFDEIPDNLKGRELCIFRAETYRKVSKQSARPRFMGFGIKYNLFGKTHYAPIPGTFRAFDQHVANKEYVDYFLNNLVKEEGATKLRIILTMSKIIPTKEEISKIMEGIVNERYKKPLGLSNGDDISCTSFTFSEKADIRTLLDLYLYLYAAFSEPKKYNLDYNYINASKDVKTIKLKGLKGDGSFRVNFYKFVFISRFIGVFEKFLDNKLGKRDIPPFYGFYKR